MITFFLSRGSLGMRSFFSSSSNALFQVFEFGFGQLPHIGVFLQGRQLPGLFHLLQHPLVLAKGFNDLPDIGLFLCDLGGALIIRRGDRVRQLPFQFVVALFKAFEFFEHK